jgi:hypothetical protein
MQSRPDPPSFRNSRRSGPAPCLFRSHWPRPASILLCSFCHLEEPPGDKDAPYLQGKDGADCKDKTDPSRLRRHHCAHEDPGYVIPLLKIVLRSMTGEMISRAMPWTTYPTSKAVPIQLAVTGEPESTHEAECAEEPRGRIVDGKEYEMIRNGHPRPVKRKSSHNLAAAVVNGIFINSSDCAGIALERRAAN